MSKWNFKLGKTATCLFSSTREVLLLQLPFRFTHGHEIAYPCTHATRHDNQVKDRFAFEHAVDNTRTGRLRHCFEVNPVRITLRNRDTSFSLCSRLAESTIRLRSAERHSKQRCHVGLNTVGRRVQPCV